MLISKLSLSSKEGNASLESQEDDGKDSQNKHTDLRPRAVFTNL